VISLLLIVLEVEIYLLTDGNLQTYLNVVHYIQINI